MLKVNQTGTINILLLPLIVVVLLLIGAGAFGVWAYEGKQDYKDNSDQKSATAVAAAIKIEDAKEQAQFAEDSKDPLKTFVGPTAYGSLHISYPKTWSAYIDESDSGNTDLDAYFYPDFVPSTTGTNSDGTPATAYALRAQILNQTYATTLQAVSQNVQAGGTTVTPYSLPKLKTVIGSEVVGTISSGITGTMVILPLRDKTVQIWTEASQFQNDFTNNVLPYVTFSP